MAKTTAATVGKDASIRKREWTFDDYLLLDDERRYEIFDGELKMAPAPSVEHQDVVFKLATLLANLVDSKALGRIVIAPVDVVLSERDVVQPDIVFIRRENFGIIREGKIFGPPDLVIEVLSPNTAHIDLHRKRVIYGKFDIPEYWIVDPEIKTVSLLKNESSRMKLTKEYSDEEHLNSTILGELDFSVSEIFNLPWE